MARSTLANLIAELRGHTAAGTADHTIGGVTFWSDDQLQTELDRVRTDYMLLPLRTIQTWEAGVSRYYDYEIPRETGVFFEEKGSGSGFALYGANATEVTTGFTVNYQARRITFAADQAGAAYQLNIRAFDLYTAAAAVWEKKAGMYAVQFDWESDNHKISASQLHRNALAMVAKYRTMGRAKTGRFVRPDEVWS
jgi:hypothetical protein